MSDLERLRNWRGSAEDLAGLIREYVPVLGLSVEPPSVRTVRYWRSIGVIGRSEGRRFAEREALEALSTLVLRSRGSGLTEIESTLKQYETDGLRDLLTSVHASRSEGFPESNRSEIRALERAQTAAVLLAQGVVRQYEFVEGEGRFVRQDDEVSSEMQDAMCLLGRLYIEQGAEDSAACLHDVLNRCRFPLDDEEWRLDTFRSASFPYAGARLVESDLRVPTPECYEIARRNSGRGLDDVVENQLHDELRRALKSSGVETAHSYTAVRQFIGRRSLTTLEELYGYCDEKKLPGRLSRLLVERFYEDVPEGWLIEGRANRCAHCGTLLRPHPNVSEYPEGRCPLSACRSVDRPEVSESLSPDDAIVCRPQILSYWVNPAIDELRIYDAARARRIPSNLYPREDRCDVSLEDGTGVDVKSYESPVSLAMRLNQNGIGGLVDYERRILAVPDFIAYRPSYLDTLKDALETAEARSLEVMPVSGVLSLIEELARA
jgi:DNA-binding transcriptional MerR regulator